MHKGVVMLAKAWDKNDALDKVREFLEPYGDGDVWDWYAIGGRWSQSLCEHNKIFNERAKEIFRVADKEYKDDGWLSMRLIEAARPELQKLWESLGAEGQNPYADHYALPENGNVYDVLPLQNCVDIVRSGWEYNPEERSIEELKTGQELYGKNSKNPCNSMLGYMMTKAGKILAEDFCFDCNVYNINEENYRIPADTTGYWAVMLDMHN